MMHLSAANLPEKFHVKDPREFLASFRQNILRRLREMKKMSLDDVVKQANISAKDLSRLESGNVDESDMAILYSLSSLYQIEYPSLLFILKLAKRPYSESTYKLAAFHDPKIDEDAQKAITEFLGNLKDNSDK